MEGYQASALTPEKIEELKERFGKIVKLHAIDSESGKEIEVIGRKPRRASFERFQDEVLKKGSKAMRNFVLENVVYPERSELERLFNEKPGLIVGILNPLQELMGADTDFTMTEL